MKKIKHITKMVLLTSSVLLLSGCGCDAPEDVQIETPKVSFVAPTETQTTQVTETETTQKTSTQTTQEVIKEAKPERIAKQQPVVKNDGSSIIIGNLIWKKCSVGQTWTGSTCSGTADNFTYSSALEYANNSNWRLPTIEELESLLYCSNGFLVPFESIDTCQKGGSDYQQPTINQSYFPNTPRNEFWSSSEYTNSTSNIWSTSFLKGGSQSHDIGVSKALSNESIAIRLVRTKRKGFSISSKSFNSI